MFRLFIQALLLLCYKVTLVKRHWHAYNLDMAATHHPHDHKVCIASALRAAADVCARRGERLTDSRRAVLEIVWREHKAVKAYDILDALSSPGHTVRPPTVYRALEFLAAQGLIHRIESLNAYIGCPHPEAAHTGQFLICDGCGTVAEVASRKVDNALTAQAKAANFAVSGQFVEVHGQCAACRMEG